MTYFKAVHMDGTDFYTGIVRWLPPVGEPLPEGGLIVRHPTARKRTTGEAAHYLSVATVPTDCTGMEWPCRLARVERTRAAVWQPAPNTLPNKMASWQWRVVEELDASLTLGPQGREVAALIERAARLTGDEVARLATAWYAAWDAARAAAGDAAWDAARCAARDAARALTVRDLISTERYDILTRPWASVIGLTEKN